MNCSSPKCSLPVDEGGLCFAHKAAALLSAVADVMREKKLLTATVGGVSASILPHALLEDPERAAVPGAAPSKNEEASEPIREDGGGLREQMNGSDFDPAIAFGAVGDP